MPWLRAASRRRRAASGVFACTWRRRWHLIAAAAALRASLVQWCVLILCMAVVLASELFNTALEHLGRAITADENAEVRDALDVAAGAVLVVAIGAGAVGVLVLIVSPLAH